MFDARQNLIDLLNMPVLELDAENYRLACEALERMKARNDEDVQEWAERLAAAFSKLTD